jgi:hypothetical protein
MSRAARQNRHQRTPIRFHAAGHLTRPQRGRKSRTGREPASVLPPGFRHAAKRSRRPPKSLLRRSHCPSGLAEDLHHLGGRSGTNRNQPQRPARPSGAACFALAGPESPRPANSFITSPHKWTPEMPVQLMAGLPSRRFPSTQRCPCPLSRLWKSPLASFFWRAAPSHFGKEKRGCA